MTQKTVSHERHKDAQEPEVPILHDGTPLCRVYLQRASAAVSRSVSARRYLLPNHSSVSAQMPQWGSARCTAIQRLREFSCPNLTVEQADFRDSLPVNADRYKFLDPPYMSANGSLYLDTNRVDLHKKFPHSELAALLRRHDKWILTYDNVEQVRAMYHGYRKTLDLQWKYSVGGKSKPSRELIIVSDDIVVPDTYTWIRD